MNWLLAIEIGAFLLGTACSLVALHTSPRH
jgi:hypothetical protein